ncbi:MAG: trypsin domain lipoprotein [Thermoleophilia bacterium]|nr:trypsin domain lipoprotein [Thermoleophilia bacterium]
MPVFTRRRLVAPIVLTIATAVALGTASSAPARSTSRVINGQQVSAAGFTSRWNAVAALTFKAEADTRKAQFCGGTFIAPDLVATAAHCVVDTSKYLILQDGARFSRYNNARSEPAALFQVTAGRRTMSVRDGERIDVAAIRVHPKYDPEINAYDVALLRLVRAPAAATGVVPMSPVLPGEDGIWGNGAGIAPTADRGPWIAGWGFTFLPNDSFFFSGAQHTPINRPTKPQMRPSANPGATTKDARAGKSTANVLEEAALPIQSDSVCDAGGAGSGMGYGRDFDPATMLCAGTLDTSNLNDDNATTNGVDSCYGDSGGPMAASTGAATRLVGIVSFGTGCATRDTYGVYTRVAAVRDFLGVRPTTPVKVAVRPKVTGSAKVGGVLRCTPGKWAGAGRVHVAYRWVRPIGEDDPQSQVIGLADEAYVRLPGSRATTTYRVRASDRGRRIGCLVIASNATTAAAENANLVKVPGKLPVDPEAEPSDDDDNEGEGDGPTPVSVGS